MSRWPGATEEPVPPHNNPTFHPRFTSTLHRHRPGGHTGLVKHREEQEEERWTTRCFSVFRFKQDLKLSVMLTESHQFKLGLPMKKNNPAASSTEFREKSCKESATKSEMFQNFQSVNMSMWSKTWYIISNIHSSSLWLSKDWNYPKQSWEKKFNFFYPALLKSLASIAYATFLFQTFTAQANIHSQTRTLPTHMHTNPTPIHTGPLWSHKTETTSRSKNTQGTHNSLLNQSNRCASRHARSLSRALKTHLNAANMFYDKWMKNMNEKHEWKTCVHTELYTALPSRDRPTSADIGLLEPTLHSSYCERENPMRGL